MNPTNRCTKDNVVEWLKPTLDKEGLKNYTINISGSSEVGDGYLGDITFVEVCGKTEEDDEKVYNFVIKCGKKSPEFREKIPVRQAFENEIYFYNIIFPTFIKFQKEKGVQDPFENAPRCYDTIILEDMEVLILENMKKIGYVLHDRRFPMERQLVEEVIKNYGKLHAISFALRDQKPEIFKTLTGNLHDVLKLMSRKPPPEDFNLYQRIIDAAKERDDHEVVEKAMILNKNARTWNDLTDPTDPYAVILHGDCWNNNFMFKYEDEQSARLSKVCFLDFQLSKLASPVYDLSYFLFTCLSEKDVPDFDDINNLYYESLSTALREMGSDPDKMFPFEELLKQWKKFSLFGLVMLPSLIQLCLSETDEVPDLVGAAESGTDFIEMFSKGVRSKDEYIRRTLPIMKLAIEKNFI